MKNHVCMKNIEEVQHRATKIIPELRNKPYEEMLQILCVYSMEYRRERGDMIQTYKILQCIDSIESNTVFTLAQYKRTRSHSMKLLKP